MKKSEDMCHCGAESLTTEPCSHTMSDRFVMQLHSENTLPFNQTMSEVRCDISDMTSPVMKPLCQSCAFMVFL